MTYSYLSDNEVAEMTAKARQTLEEVFSDESRLTFKTIDVYHPPTWLEFFRPKKRRPSFKMRGVFFATGPGELQEGIVTRQGGEFFIATKKWREAEYRAYALDSYIVWLTSDTHSHAAAVNAVHRVQWHFGRLLPEGSLLRMELDQYSGLVV